MLNLINGFQTAQSKSLESKISGIDGKIGNRYEKNPNPKRKRELPVKGERGRSKQRSGEREGTWS